MIDHRIIDHRIMLKITLTAEEVRASIYPSRVIRPLPWEVPREELLARARLLNNLPSWLKTCIRESILDEIKEER